MSVKTPAAFEDSTGTIERLTGELEIFGAASAGQVLTVDVGGKTASWQATGVTTAREQVSGNTVTVTNGATGSLTWDVKESGSDLLDLTAPAAPTAVADGVYAVTVTCLPATITVGGYYTLALALDQAGDNALAVVTSPSSVAANQTPIVSVGLTYFVPAGGAIVAVVDNEDGVASVDFALQVAVVQAI